MCNEAAARSNPVVRIPRIAGRIPGGSAIPPVDPTPSPPAGRTLAVQVPWNVSGSEVATAEAEDVYWGGAGRPTWIIKVSWTFSGAYFCV